MATSKSKRASEIELSELHGELAQVYRKGLSWRDPETGKPDVGLLNGARQFLKDNKIEAEATPGSPLGDLADLPVFDNDTDFGYPAH